MAHRLNWNNLSIGTISVAAILALAAAILVFGRVGRLHGKTFRLFVTTDEARGVIRGTEVWLDGQKVGLVKSVGFQVASAAPTDRLVLSIEVLADVQPLIRRDSRVMMRSGGSVISDQVVYLTIGTARTAGVHDGDTIHAVPSTDYESLTADAAATSHQLPAIIDNVKLIGAQLRTAQSTLGAFGLDSGSEMRELEAKSNRVLSRLSSSRGTAGLTLSSRGALELRAREAMAAADSLRRLIGSSNQRSLGRFHRDSTLSREIAAVRAELARVQRLAVSPTGTVGRFRTDSTITHGLHRDIASLDSLMADVRKHPFRYIAF